MSDVANSEPLVPADAVDTSPVATSLASMQEDRQILSLRQGEVTSITNAHGASGTPNPRVSVKVGASPDATTDLRYLGASPAVGDSVWILDNEVDKLVLGPLAAALPPGAVQDFAGTTIPPGWLECNGQAVSRTGFARLFAAIGTLHGAGDGSTTFNVPDLRDRFIVGIGPNFGVANVGGNAHGHNHSLGTLDDTIAGSHAHGAVGNHDHPRILKWTTTLTHDHSGSADTAAEGVGAAAGGSYTSAGSGGGSHSHPSGGDHHHSFTGRVGNSGGVDGDASWSNLPPFYSLKRIIKV